MSDTDESDKADRDLGQLKAGGDAETILFRTVAGLALGGAAVLAAFGGFIYAAVSLSELAAREPRTDQHAHFLMAVLAAKAVVSGAFLTFCYALGRAGERFLIPHWWVRTEADRRIAMGARDHAPTNPSADVLKGAADTAKAAVELAKGKAK